MLGHRFIAPADNTIRNVYLHMIARDWTMVRQLLKVTSKVVRYGNVSEEIRYYISNLPVTAKEFLHIICSHWAIENSLQYVKDEAFLEDFNQSYEN